MTDQPTAVVESLQRVLAGEHAAVYAYEVIGGRLQAGSRSQQRAGAAYRHHRARRDALTTQLRAADTTPVVAEPGYALPVEVTGPASAGKLAVHVEGRCTALYAQVVAASSGRDRKPAIEAMTWCAEQRLAWGGSSSALPGVGRG